MKPFEKEIATLIIDTLMLTDVTVETMEAEASLVHAYGLDSIDFLELAMTISKRYGVEFAEGDETNATHFESVRSLATHIEAHRPDEPEVPQNETFEERAYREIVAGLCEMFDFPEESLQRETLLVADLGLDSLDALDLIVRLQDTLGARIPDDRLTELETIGDVVAITVELGRESEVA